MPTDPNDPLKDLAAPFAPEDLEWKPGKVIETKDGPRALAMAYVTNRAIMDRLDHVLGPGNWQVSFREWRQKGVICTISVRVGDAWISKEDGADETDIESMKGGLSSAQKRAAVQLGIGRDLYSIEEQWAPYDPKKKRIDPAWTPRLPAANLQAARGSSPAPRARNDPGDGQERRKPPRRQGDSGAPETAPRQQAKPQAVSEPPFWDENVGTGVGYFSMSWRDAYEQDGQEFVAWLEGIVDEVLTSAGGDREKARKMATDKEKQIAAAYAYLTKGSKP